MSYFLTREDNRQQVGGRNGGGNYASPMDANPGSPLSRFVQEGYNPNAGGMLGAANNQSGFDAGIAQQWNSNVQQTRVAHQQSNDPNFVVKQVKSHGYRVSNAPGGASSISLSWDEAPSNGALDPGRRGRGVGAYTPPDHAVGGAALRGGGMAGCLGGGAWGAPGQDNASYQPPSPSANSTAAGSRRGVQSREGGGMAGCIGNGSNYGGGSHPSSREGQRPGAMPASYGSAAYDSRAAPFGGGGGQYAAPPPMQQQQFGGGRGRDSDSTSLAFGNQADRGSSNAYASGANQNCGNGITDRRTTRVLAPPGGASQISFG